jgi:hypothetical protein
VPSLYVGEAEVFEVTLTLDTAAYATGDVLSDTATITRAVIMNGGRARLVSIVVIDEDDVGDAFDIVFMSQNRSLGTKNAAPSISDANARDILGAISVASGDYIDLGGVRAATKSGLDLLLEAVAGSRDVFLGTITRGVAPTYTANGLRLRLGLVAA